jgi:hypothetical protein
MFTRQHGKVIKHLQGGMNILVEALEKDRTLLQTKSSSACLIPLEHLMAIFAVLEIHITGLSTPGPLLFLDFTALSLRSEDENVNAPLTSALSYFSNVIQAWTTLNGYWHCLLYIMHGATSPRRPNIGHSRVVFTRNHSKLKKAFLDWNQAFNLMINQRTNGLSAHGNRITALLEAHYLMGIGMLNVDSEQGEMGWDCFLDEFQRQVDLCAIFLKNENTASQPGLKSRRASGKRPLSYSMDYGVVPALFHAIWRCRDAAVRQQAIQLLEDYPCVEGLWDGLLIASVGRRIDEIERQGESLVKAAQRRASSEEIPERRRILGIDPVMSFDNRHANIMFSQPKDLFGTELTIISDDFSW